ncbi:energy transducer TonB [candidate division KSB1 bacterium]
MSLTKDQRNSIFSTALFLLLFVLILIFTSLTFQVPPPDEEGVEVNLGYDNQGFGDIQPEEPGLEDPSASKAAKKDDIATQNAEKTPKIDKSKTYKKVTRQTQDQLEEDQQKLKFNPADYLNRNKGGSEGESGGEGDEGSPFGSDADNYNGIPGSGMGPSYSLLGREAKFLPTPSKNFEEQGTVVVSIWVDRNGKVTRVEPGARGTNSTDAILWKLAKEAAFKSKFSLNPDAPEVQKGTITYNFIKLK